MDSELYIKITNIICLISLIGSIYIIANYFKRRLIKPSGAILLLCFLFGMYSYIPMKIMTSGVEQQNHATIEKAIKLSLNPFEKRLGYKYLAEMYAEDPSYKGIRDGNKAIKYMELAINGQYERYRKESSQLIYWYSIKGHENRVFKLAQIPGIDKNLALRNIYIMKNDYYRALQTFGDQDTGIENFLKAELCKKTNSPAASRKAYDVAQSAFIKGLSNIEKRYF